MPAFRKHRGMKQCDTALHRGHSYSTCSHSASTKYMLNILSFIYRMIKKVLHDDLVVHPYLEAVAYAIQS